MSSRYSLMFINYCTSYKFNKLKQKIRAKIIKVLAKSIKKVLIKK